MGPGPLAIGYGADRLFADPSRGHPVAIFGAAAAALERVMWRPARPAGFAYAAVLIGAAGSLTCFVDRALAGRPRAQGLFQSLVVWTVLGGRSLEMTAVALNRKVDGDDLRAARAIAPALAGRDPDALDSAGLLRMTVESVAENTSDAVVASLVWAALLGPAGAVAHRATNTLDAMVGHRSERYREFGSAAAVADDIANWIPARATAGLVALLSGRGTGLLRVAAPQARRHPSPNAGWSEAAFAHALQVELGGPTVYAGGSDERPVLGAGRGPTVRDVQRAVALAARVDLVALAAAITIAALRRG